ncbi:MAG: ABC transporter ATP-binding protein [Kiloniellales bacterium]
MALFEAHNLHKRFGARVVLEDISLAFEEGQVSGIMGPNGAGKTTCFNLLTGRYKPNRGSIRFDGRDITGLAPQRIARLGIARSFQIMTLFDQSAVIENVLIALPAFQARRNRMTQAVFKDRALLRQASGVLEQVGLAGRAWEPSAALSYGDRRALEIGVALAARPRMLFLDEPTSGLGAEGRERLADLIGQLREDYTIVMIEHDMEFLFRLADRISVLHWGQVIAEGDPAALMANKWVQRSSLGAVS